MCSQFGESALGLSQRVEGEAIIGSLIQLYLKQICTLELGDSTKSFFLKHCVRVFVCLKQGIITEILKLIKINPMKLELKSLLFLVILSVVTIGIFHHTKV